MTALSAQRLKLQKEVFDVTEEQLVSCIAPSLVAQLYQVKKESLVKSGLSGYCVVLVEGGEVQCWMHFSPVILST